MQLKITHFMTAGIFFAALFGVLIAYIIVPDADILKSERREPEAFPEFTAEAVFDTEWMTDFEKYTLDQFPGRDAMRMLKAFSCYYIFGQKDNNDVYIADGSVGKLEYPLNESSVIRFAQKLEQLCLKYLKDSDVYLALVPDKNYFLAEQNGYPSLDYDKLRELVYSNLDTVKTLDIFGTLKLSDYYTTDTHWKQECIGGTAQAIAQGMGFDDRLSWDFESHSLGDFYGVYYGQAALPVLPDEMIYLTNDVIDSAEVYNIETQSVTGVYDLDKLTDGKSLDMYDIYLSGAAAILEISNPNAKTDDELIIFRDSFGSSITPYFIEGYSKITMIDIRYITSDLLEEFVDFHGQDVLFLYSTLVVNNSAMLK